LPTIAGARSLSTDADADADTATGAVLSRR
jgi:hypothetical protein